MTSAIPGFFKLSIQERHQALQDKYGILPEDLELFKNQDERNLTLEQADSMVENVIAMHSTPIGVATNFIVDGRNVIVPMANEEPSVIAGASNAAKLCRATGGFTTACGSNICSGQIVLIVDNVEELDSKIALVSSYRDEIISLANSTMPNMTKRGGGVIGVDIRSVKTKSSCNIIVTIHIDVCEAMGANCVNHACEFVGHRLSEETGLELLMAILTNLADHRIVHAKAKWPVKSLAQGGYTGPQVAQRIIMAAEFAKADAYRAATHRKGIMNGVTAVVLATGNDTRAVESSVHSYATQSENPALTSFHIDNEMNLVGEISLPIPVGIVGGTIKRNKTIVLMRKLLKADDSSVLARTIAAVGLASNFAAVRALVTNGICSGHMKLHSRNIACQAGAKDKEIDTIAAKLIESGNITVSNAIMLLQCNLT